MKNIIFTIKTDYSEENYFLALESENNIECQIDDALADICFCDDYKVINIQEVSNDYIEKRNKAIKEYKKVFKEYPNKYMTLEAIEGDIYDQI